MRQFFKIVFATVTGLFLFLFLLILLLIVVLSASAPEKEHISQNNSILKITLDKELGERKSDNLWQEVGIPGTGEPGSIGVLELREALEFAAKDEKVKGVFLEFRNFQSGMGLLEEFRNAIIEFKKSGKFVLAYGETYSEGAYYLASAADHIYLPPSGMVEFNGLDVELMFFKGTLEKLELKPEVFKVGNYKSAVEPFIRDSMSTDNRQQLTELLNSVYNHFLQNIAASRQIPIEKLRLLSDSMLVRNGKDALDQKLVTNLEYYDQAESWMKTATEAKEKLNFVSLDSYLSSKKAEGNGKSSQNKIAVIFANGDIVDGEGNENTIGSKTFAEEFRKARTDEKVKAIVLRVNSPGGSALASDIIWREVALCEKPVIASMADYAASGGYYISMACDTIVAQPTTITGSIGVFGLMLNGSKFLSNKLGITTDRTKTGKFSDIGSFTREFTDYERKVIQQEVEHIYDEFITKAAAGRKTSKEQINEVGQGRVWSGAEAKGQGLVDVFGGLPDAIKIASNSAKLGDDYEIVYFPEKKESFLKDIMVQALGDEETKMKEELQTLFPYYNSLKDVMKMEGVQARIPYKLIIK